MNIDSTSDILKGDLRDRMAPLIEAFGDSMQACNQAEKADSSLEFSHELESAAEHLLAVRDIAEWLLESRTLGPVFETVWSGVTETFLPTIEDAFRRVAINFERLEFSQFSERELLITLKSFQELDAASYTWVQGRYSVAEQSPFSHAILLKIFSRDIPPDFLPHDSEKLAFAGRIAVAARSPHIGSKIIEGIGFSQPLETRCWSAAILRSLAHYPGGLYLDAYLGLQQDEAPEIRRFVEAFPVEDTKQLTFPSAVTIEMLLEESDRLMEEEKFSWDEAFMMVLGAAGLEDMTVNLRDDPDVCRAISNSLHGFSLFRGQTAIWEGESYLISEITFTTAEPSKLHIVKENAETLSIYELLISDENVHCATDFEEGMLFPKDGTIVLVTLTKRPPRE